MQIPYYQKYSDIYSVTSKIKSLISSVLAVMRSKLSKIFKWKQPKMNLARLLIALL